MLFRSGSINYGSYEINNQEAEKIELIRTVVAEEVYKQLITAWPKTSGPVKGLKVPNQDYRQTAPPGNGSPR